MNPFFSFCLDSCVNIFLYYNIGFMYLILSRIVFHTAINLVFLYYYKLEPLNNIGLLFYALPDNKKFFMTGGTVLEGYKPDQISDIILNKGIKNFSMLRKRLRYFFGNYYWEEVSYEDASKTVKILDIRLNNTSEVTEYILKEQEKCFGPTDLLYEFQILKYEENNTIIISKFDHTLSDGIGMMGFSIGLCDNYDISLFPQMKSISFFSYLLMNLASPFYAIIALINTIKVQGRMLYSPFKREKKEVGKKILEVSKTYNFTKFTTVAKEMGLTFNDLIITLVSKNAKKMHTKYSNNNDEFIISIPISLRPMPKSLSEFVIDNQVSNQIFKCPLINDLSEYKKVQTVLNKYLKNPFYNIGSLFNFKIGMLFTPIFVLKYTFEDSVKNVDFAISNVPCLKLRFTMPVAKF